MSASREEMARALARPGANSSRPFPSSGGQFVQVGRSDMCSGLRKACVGKAPDRNGDEKYRPVTIYNNFGPNADLNASTDNCAGL